MSRATPEYMASSPAPSSSSIMMESEGSTTARHCAFCLRVLVASEVKRCGKCNRRSYCPKVCQAADWSLTQDGQGHKHWCEIQCGEEDIDWTVQPISEEKGLGIVAKRRLPSGYRILVDRGLESMPLKHAARLTAVKDLEPRTGSLQEKWSLNALGTGPDDPSVLCMRLSRANHACDANSIHVYDPDHKVKILLATRVIDAGEEICFSYVSFDDPASDISAEASRTILREKWGIVCSGNCRCRDEDLLRRVNQKRELDKSIDPLAMTNPTLALVAAKRLLRMHEEDKAASLTRVRTLYDAFQVAVVRRETLEEAKDFARQAHELAATIFHPKTREVLRYDELSKTPSQHQNYLLFEGSCAVQ